MVFVFILTLLGSSGSWAFTFSEGRKAYEKGDYGKAEEYFREKSSKSGDPESSYSLGGALYRQGKYDQAGSAFEGAVDRSKDLQAAWYNLGNSYFRQDRFKDAIQAYEQALALNPKDEDARANLELAKKKLKQDPRKDKSQAQKKEPKEEKKQEDRKSDQEDSSAKKEEGKKEGDRKDGKQQAGQQGQDPSQDPQADQQRKADNQRRERAKRELGLNDKQIQDLMDQMQKWEAGTQRYFSKDPKRERGKAADPWSHLPPQQREFLNRFFGQPAGKSQAVQEDW